MAWERVTLADHVVRETLRPHTHLTRLTNRSMSDLRAAMLRARRLVLDESMSSFLADLSCVPFLAHPERRPEMLETLRHGARLPHAATWIELDGRAHRARLLELREGAVDMFGNILSTDVVPRWGYLMEEHPQVATAVRMSEFVLINDRVCNLPFYWVYGTTDDPLPWRGADPLGGMIGHGITSYVCARIGLVSERPIAEDWRVECVLEDESRFVVHKMAAETAGVVRTMLALLATLADVPTVLSEVRPQHGFVARGRYRKFLDHTVVRLSIPQRVERTALARRLVVMARRRAHVVRGHWRVLHDWGEGPTKRCPPSTHVWGAASESGRATCAACGAARRWIAEHQRGDASLGFVTHNYELTHREGTR